MSYVTRKTISLPERLADAAMRDAKNLDLRFSDYVRRLIEQRLGVGLGLEQRGPDVLYSVGQTGKVPPEAFEPVVGEPE